METTAGGLAGVFGINLWTTGPVCGPFIAFARNRSKGRQSLFSNRKQSPASHQAVGPVLASFVNQCCRYFALFLPDFPFSNTASGVDLEVPNWGAMSVGHGGGRTRTTGLPWGMRVPSGYGIHGLAKTAGGRFPAGRGLQVGSVSSSFGTSLWFARAGSRGRGIAQARGGMLRQCEGVAENVVLVRP